MSESDIQALADQAEADVAALGLVGVPDPEQRPYEMATETISLALDRTRDRLIELRNQKATLAAEIKLLVEETELLDRMWRVANKQAKGG
jgi:hypothetical protein